MNRIYVTLSMAIRTAASLAIYAVLARGLGPSAFGLVAGVLAYATMASFLTDFGFSIKTLRDIGEHPSSGAAVLSSTLHAKILLCFCVLGGGAVCVFLLPLDAQDRFVALFISAGIIVASVGDLSLVAFRAVGRYSAELRITLWTSFVYLATIGPTALYRLDIHWVALAFFISRLVYAAAAVWSAARLFPGAWLFCGSFVGTLRQLRGAWAWATDSGLGYVNGQADAIVAIHLFGLHGAGLYLACARFAQGALTLVSVLANVHIPRLASRGSVAHISGGEKLVVAEFVALGCVLALGLLVGGPIITRNILGPQYLPANVLWPGFACFVFTRFLASAFGAVLSAYGAPKIRILGQLSTITVLLIGCLFVRDGGLVVLPWLMTVGAGVTTLFYFCGRLWLRRTASHVESEVAQTLGNTNAIFD